MSKLREAVKKEKAFIAFLTAGDPDIACTERYVRIADRAGAAVIELGVPFSDPIAEGAVIQEANARALRNGITLDDIFAMCARLSGLRAPLVLLTYLNPVFRYGYDALFAACRRSGVAGVIIPDCPFEERGELLPAADRCGIDVITLIAPTSRERTRMLAKSAEGFIYLVSSMGVTGVRSEITTDVAAICADIRSVTGTPVCVGFGIAEPRQAREMAAIADGAIVGSAIVRLIARYGAAADGPLEAYIREMVQAVRDA